MVNFATLVPDEQYFPVEAFTDCLNHVMKQDGPRLLQYCGTMGYPPLRELIAEMMQGQGIKASPDQILVVNGSQQGLDLVLRCFLSPGDRIALSLPTYHHIFPIIEQMRAGVASVPMTEKGPDLDRLKEASLDGLVRLIYTMPNFQNPTGVTCDEAHREGIIKIAERADLPVLEDDFEKDLVLEDHPARPIKALDTQGRVIYLATFSKSLFPGLRIGWLVASKEIFRALAVLKKATDLENSALLQGAAHEFCRRGHYEEHLVKIKALIRERMDAALESLELNMPEGASWTRPRGGYVLWIHLPPGVSSERVFQEGKNAGVLVSPGTLFSYRGIDPGGVRLSLSRTDTSQIRKGIKILGRVITAEMKQDRGEVLPAPETPQHL